MFEAGRLEVFITPSLISTAAWSNGIHGLLRSMEIGDFDGLSNLEKLIIIGLDLSTYLNTTYLVC